MTDSMIGEGGTQITSRTLFHTETLRIDVENPSPGVRPGQLHLQDDAGNKYLYDFDAHEVKDLPRGSTPLDMAYRIHTDLGDHCAGARIITNMDDTGRLVTRLVPLDYELKGGEIVDIMVNNIFHPTREWLSFSSTPITRTNISC